MFITVFVAFIIGFMLVILLKRRPAAISYRYINNIKNDKEGIQEIALIGKRDFFALCYLILETSGLSIRAKRTIDDRNVELVAEDKSPIKGGIFIVQCIFSPDSPLDKNIVLQIKEMIKAEGALKGVIFTNGFFYEEVYSDTGVVELIDGERLAGYKKELSISV